MRYLVIDTESGGIGEEFSLLSAFFTIVTEKGKVIDELDLKLIPNNGIFVLSQEGMKVNQIDIRNWEGIKYKEAKKLLFEFLAKGAKYKKADKGYWIKDFDSQRMRVVGQQVDGDIKRICNTIISKEMWDDFVATVPLDTLYIATFLRDQGLLNLKSLSLRSLGEYFGLDISRLHTAEGDVILNWQVYDKLGELVRR